MSVVLFSQQMSELYKWDMVSNDTKVKANEEVTTEMRSAEHKVTN